MDEQNMAENYSGDVTATTEMPAVEEQTAEDGFLAGFEAEDLTREQVEAESDSKENADEATKETINNPENTDNHQSGRAEKRIRQLLAKNREQEAELAEYRQWKASQNKPELRVDEDGNATPEDFAEYNRELIAQEIARAREEDALRYEEMAKERDLDNSIHSIQAGVAERVTKHPFLNPDSEEYNPEAERIISRMVLGQIQQLQASGISDYSGMAELALETMDQQIELIYAASQQAKINAMNSIDSMRNGGALVSSNQGSQIHRDDFEEVFSS